MQKLSRKGIVIGIIIFFIVLIGCLIGKAYIEQSSTYLYGLIDKGKVDNVVKLYNISYKGKYEKEQDFLRKIDAYLNQNSEDFVNDIISYEQAIQKYNVIEIAISRAAIGNFPVISHKKRLEEEKSLKNIYKQGLTYLEQKQYKDAIESFKKLLQQSKQYPNALKKLQEAENGYHQSILTDSETMLAKNDYSGAIKLLKSGVDYFKNKNDTAFLEKLAEVQTTVINNSLSAAENNFINNGYQQAISDIESAINIVGTNDKLSEALNKYKEYIPVNIYDMKCSEKSSKSLRRSEISSDNTNKTHQKVLYAYHKTAGDINPYEVYPLMGKYDTLTFEAYRNNTEYTKTSDEEIAINIYGDEILLQKIIIRKNFVPQTYSLDISNVQKLKIEFECGWLAYGVKGWMDPLPGELANVIVAKTKK